jgi:hypothetical protein
MAGYQLGYGDYIFSDILARALGKARFTLGACADPSDFINTPGSTMANR